MKCGYVMSVVAVVVIVVPQLVRDVCISTIDVVAVAVIVSVEVAVTLLVDVTVVG